MILDSQPAVSCCCWNCQPVVIIHYGRGGSRAPRRSVSMVAFPGNFPCTWMLISLGGSLAASLQHSGLCFWWRWRGLMQISVNQPWVTEWTQARFPQLWGWSSLLVATSTPTPGMPHSFWPIHWEDNWAVLYILAMISRDTVPKEQY